MICLMGGVGWHGTRLGRSDSTRFKYICMIFNIVYLLYFYL